MRRRFLTAGLLSAAILGISFAAPAAKAQDGFVNCTDEQLQKCGTPLWGTLQGSYANSVESHHCEWHGLTIKCTDKEYKYCPQADGQRCYLQPNFVDNPRTVPGIYQVSDFVGQFVKVAQWGLGLVVLLAALMFVWAGWQFVTAGGREHQIAEGRNIITGTITGLIVSFAAYVIINFAVFALTGTSIKTQNGGWLAVLFPLETFKGPFSGETTNVENRTSCRSANNDTWDKNCSDHVLCADSGTGSDGPVAQLQKRLNALHCACGGGGPTSTSGVDGCYGPLTVDCVRKFQLANTLPPTGVVDAATAAAVSSPSAVACDNPAVNADSVMSNLPKAILPFSATGTGPNKFDSSANGCCIVSDGTDDLYCLQNVTSVNCETLDGRGGNIFIAGKTCAGSNTNNRCGFCQSTQDFSFGGDHNCFELATPTWCASYSRDSAGDALGFLPSSCQFGRCSGICRTTLMTTLR